ncbi:MAG: MBL fold metallo-hydrolase [Bauldia sp.]|nr:MBL fold metallo-hydrolase [Bauldia sp.]
MPAASGPITVRHYCQGIGDCHLLRFPRADGGDFWMLIDCGLHSSVKGGPGTIARIVADIAERTGRIDVVVVTHEHWDHVSGFLTETEAFGRLSVGEVWMGWTENPADRQAQELDTFKSQALAALQMASAAFNRTRGLSPFQLALGKGVDAVLGFNFGAKGERVRAARDAAAKLASEGIRYLDPTGRPPLTLPGLPNLRIYVLGPPRDARLLGLTERASEMYGLGGSGWPLATALGNALKVSEGAGTVDYAMPFEPNVGTRLSDLRDPRDDADPANAAFYRDRYLGSKTARSEDDVSWRRIDADWLGASADLALQLDRRTNNTSLVLAFEFVDSRRVLLFAADAQVGNWLSWHDLAWTVDGATVTAADLLSRTVFYKVGHHGSENATLKAKGLELMRHEDLAAFIPTSEADAKKVGWGEMPFHAITEELARRTAGRTIRADDSWIAEEDAGPSFPTPSGAIRALRHRPGLWVEFDLA